jgi:integrase/recombinase XerD
MFKFNYSSLTQFQQHVDLKDYRLPTKKEYVRNLRKLAEHFQSDPAKLTENQLREYFLFLRQPKGYKHSAMKAAKFALRCFYRECLKLTIWTVFEEVPIAEQDVLPVVLSRAEVQALLPTISD